MGKWNKLNFKQLIVRVSVYRELTGLRKPVLDSLSDVIQRLLASYVRSMWAVRVPMTPRGEAFWKSDLFVRK